jgi:hypothetical protein
MILQRRAFAGGEVRVLAGAVTERIFEYEEAGQIHRERWDPRDEGTTMVLIPRTWLDGLEIDSSARERILDAIRVVSAPLGVQMMLEAVFDEDCVVARRWNRAPDGFLIDVDPSGTVDYLELGRTARFSLETIGRQFGLVRVPRQAQWIYPAGAPIVDRAIVLTRLGSTRPEDQRLSSHPWSLRVLEVD